LSPLLQLIRSWVTSFGEFDMVRTGWLGRTDYERQTIAALRGAITEEFFREGGNIFFMVDRFGPEFSLKGVR
jgi:hypothetical protein